MEEEILISIIGGGIVWSMTWVTRGLFPKGEMKDAIRHWTPEIAGILAVAVVAGWQTIEGNEVLSFETLKHALGAAGSAVFGHSLIKEKLKMLKTGGTSGGLGPLVLFICLFSSLGCGGSPVKGLEYLPDISISNPSGCPDVMVRQNLPAPSGWSVMNETRIKKDCPKPSNPPTPNPES